MSTWFAESLTCPACAHAFAASLVRGASAVRAPALRDAALAGALHAVRCPACDAHVTVPHDVVYADVERGHWIHLATPDVLPRWAEVERAALAAFDRATRGTSPLAAALAGRVQPRVVFDAGELRERLVCWDAGLDDAVLECVKLRNLRDRPDVRRPDERIRLLDVAPDGALSMAAIGRAAPHAVHARWLVPRATYDAITADVATWRAAFPALFAPGFVACDRYLS